MELHVKDSVNFSFYIYEDFLSEVHSACLIKHKLDQNTFYTEEKKNSQLCVFFFSDKGLLDFLKFVDLSISAVECAIFKYFLTSSLQCFPYFSWLFLSLSLPCQEKLSP